MAAEGARLADLRDISGGSPLMAAVRPSTAPHRLGRAGRRSWRSTERDNRKARLQVAIAAEAEAGESDRYVGAMLLMVAVLIVIGLRMFVFGSHDDPTPIAPAPVATVTPTYHAVPTTPPTPPHPYTWSGQ